MHQSSRRFAFLGNEGRLLVHCAYGRCQSGRVGGRNLPLGVASLILRGPQEHPLIVDGASLGDLLCRSKLSARDHWDLD